MAAETPRLCLLLRHGTPVPEEVDPEKPLSDQGRAEAAFTANGIAEYLKSNAGDAPKKAAIMHSGKARAQQTAEAVASLLVETGWEAPCEGRDGLGPQDDPKAAIEILEGAAAPVVIMVGHLPHMGFFSAGLVGSPAAAGRLKGLFHPAGGLVLQRKGAAWEEAEAIVPGVSWWMEAPPPPPAA